jgi:UDP-glucose 4-epimerase
MKILVTGGCGYKGHVLIPKLLDQEHQIIAFDIQWFGIKTCPQTQPPVTNIFIKIQIYYHQYRQFYPLRYTYTASENHLS